MPLPILGLKFASSIPDGFIEIFNSQSFRTHYGLGVDFASNRNENQEYFLGDKGGRCIGQTTLPPSCVVLKIGSLNLLEPPGPVHGLLNLYLYLKYEHNPQTNQLILLLEIITVSSEHVNTPCGLNTEFLHVKSR
jgi:hypothetical protein